MALFDSPAFEGHEAVHAFHDKATGLKCFIAIHSTRARASASAVQPGSPLRCASRPAGITSAPPTTTGVAEIT